MLDTDRLVAFVATTDAARARVFYEKTLGLALVEESPFASVFRSGETSLRVTTVKDMVRAPYTVLGWAVTDVVSAIRDLASRGVTFERFPGMSQDELGIWNAPGGAKVAWFKDPDGNVLSLTES